MSYWIHLEDDEQNVAVVPAHAEGGTYAMGGTSEADLNVTYNYSKIFSIREHLDGKTAGSTILMLEALVAFLGTETDEDYWKATNGNVGHMLNTLLGWARLHPTFKWKVT